MAPQRMMQSESDLPRGKRWMRADMGNWATPYAMSAGVSG
jgi:hypothetical protein